MSEKRESEKRKRGVRIRGKRELEEKERREDEKRKRGMKMRSKRELEVKDMKNAAEVRVRRTKYINERETD